MTRSPRPDPVSDRRPRCSRTASSCQAGQRDHGHQRGQHPAGRVAAIGHGHDARGDADGQGGPGGTGRDGADPRRHLAGASAAGPDQGQLGSVGSGHRDRPDQQQDRGGSSDPGQQQRVGGPDGSLCGDEVAERPGPVGQERRRVLQRGRGRPQRRLPGVRRPVRLVIAASIPGAPGGGRAGGAHRVIPGDRGDRPGAGVLHRGQLVRGQKEPGGPVVVPQAFSVTGAASAGSRVQNCDDGSRQAQRPVTLSTSEGSPGGMARVAEPDTGAGPQPEPGRGGRGDRGLHHGLPASEVAVQGSDPEISRAWRASALR